MLRHTLLATALTLSAALPGGAQERPPIALPAPSLAPSTPRASGPDTSTLTADILALAVAVEAAGCRLNRDNSASVLAASGLNPVAAEIAKNAMLSANMATPIEGGLALDTCQTPTSPAPNPEASNSAPASAEQPDAEEPEPLTILQRRRCEDRPTLPFCP